MAVGDEREYVDEPARGSDRAFEKEEADEAAREAAEIGGHTSEHSSELEDR